METEIKFVQVAAAVLHRGGRILVARRPPGDALEGQWEFPGGKLEAGESPEVCLRRELQEELHLDCTIGPYLTTVRHRYPKLEVELIVHAATPPDDLPAALASTAHSELRWVTPAEMSELVFAAADVPVVELLQRGGTLA
jgi:8-oxo-dGTP diphosphatase